MFLEQPYHQCEDPEYESTGVTIFEDGKAEFKYDCVARDTSKHYKHSHEAIASRMTVPCGATNRVTLHASDSVDEDALELVESLGSDQHDAVEIIRADPPTPTDPDGLFVVEAHGKQVIYR